MSVITSNNRTALFGDGLSCSKVSSSLKFDLLNACSLLCKSSVIADLAADRDLDILPSLRLDTHAVHDDVFLKRAITA